VEQHFIGAGQWTHLQTFSYWIGYRAQSGIVTSSTGQNLGPVTSSRSPFLHFVQYDGSASQSCVAANPRYSYQIFEWW
jgi:hypothetical protein